MKTRNSGGSTASRMAQGAENSPGECFTTASRHRSALYIIKMKINFTLRTINSLENEKFMLSSAGEKAR